MEGGQGPISRKGEREEGRTDIIKGREEGWEGRI